MELRFGCADRNSQHCRDFRVRIAINTIQVNDEPVAFGQLVEQAQDLAGFDRVKEPVEAVIGRLILVIADVFLPAEFEIAPVQVDGGILHDPFHPTFKGLGFAPERSDVVKHFQKGFLQNIFRFESRAAIPEGDAIEYPVVFFIQPLISALFSRLTAFNDMFQLCQTLKKCVCV